jgi:hypothetical protein
MIYLVKIFRICSKFAVNDQNVQNFQSMLIMFSQCSESDQNFQSMCRIFSEFSVNVQNLFRMFSQCSEYSETVQNFQSMLRIFNNVQTLLRIPSTKTGLFRIS